MIPPTYAHDTTYGSLTAMTVFAQGPARYGIRSTCLRRAVDFEDGAIIYAFTSVSDFEDTLPTDEDL